MHSRRRSFHIVLAKTLKKRQISVLDAIAELTHRRWNLHNPKVDPRAISHRLGRTFGKKRQLCGCAKFWTIRNVLEISLRTSETFQTYYEIQPHFKVVKFREQKCRWKFERRGTVRPEKGIRLLVLLKGFNKVSKKTQAVVVGESLSSI